MTVKSSPAPRIFTAIAILALVIAGVFPLFAWYGYQRYGTTGLATAGIAAAICFFSGALALVVTGRSIGSNSPVGLLFSMLIRTGIPLAAGLVLSSNFEILRNAGVFGMILVYYLITLSVETTLAVRLIGGGKTSPSPSTPPQAA